jgi:flagellar biosynthesis component FlhA
MKPRLIVAILVIAGLSLCAEAQEPSAAKADAQKFVKMIIGDKAKSQISLRVQGQPSGRHNQARWPG